MNKPTIHVTGEAEGILPAHDNKGKPITVIGNESIRQGFGDYCLEQAQNARSAPGVTEVVLNPDAHVGYGAPVGCVMASPSHIYPGPVGVDIKCSMSLLQLDIPEDVIEDRRTRRALINAIGERTPTGAGKGTRSVPKGRSIDFETGRRAATEGGSADVLGALGVPIHWAERCEDAAHGGHDDSRESLETRLDDLIAGGDRIRFQTKFDQLGSYGGGNHFGECEVVETNDREQASADVFGLRNGHVAFLSHCGSRGFGHDLASNQFKALQSKFDLWGTAYPADDRQLVYAPLGTPEADAYLDDMALGANFATVNHLLINALVLDAFQEVLPGCGGELVYFISHNIARQELIDNQLQWVHRKGATRAFPAFHHGLKETPFHGTGHPILLPGNPRDGSVVMRALPGAEKSCFSVNHGAGRRLSRSAAKRELDQKEVNEGLDAADILTNCRSYPRDEAPDSYKDFGEVLDSVESAGLATPVARLKARFVIKDASKADD